MLDIVAGEDSINRCICHGRHIQHGAHDIRLDVFVDIQAKFFPIRSIESTGGLLFPFGAATDVEEGFHIIISPYRRQTTFSQRHNRLPSGLVNASYVRRDQ